MLPVFDPVMKDGLSSMAMCKALEMCVCPIFVRMWQQDGVVDARRRVKDAEFVGDATTEAQQIMDITQPLKAPRSL